VWDKTTIMDSYLIYCLKFNNIKFLTHLINKYGSQFEFNELMVDCIKKSLEELQSKGWKKASIEKKGILTNFFMPMHAVVLSSDPNKLDLFITNSGDMNIQDSMGIKPLH